MTPTPSLKEAKSSRPGHEGHRARLRARFLGTGPDSLADHELIELLLFAALPRRDTKAIAHDLLARFKTFAAVLAASPTDLMKTRGLGESGTTALKAAQATALRLMRSEIIKRPIMSSWKQVIDYCTASMAEERIELFRIIFLDRQNQLIADEVQQKGTVDHTPVYPREVVKRALELSATAFVLVHNHPTGDPKPSRADIDMTRAIAQAAAPLGITIHDHLIIGRKGHYSFKATGLL
ncbi:MAG TPA: hypothetical protein DCW68_06040 [Rhodospirillaceae bacterium]|nr:MAG: hypothetical protein A2018_03605 [Alphaproteobacteria bacterium GWF2_58_20]HAU29654.1 hypothetical protein [Rhodospirillaceae bacterium]